MDLGQGGDCDDNFTDVKNLEELIAIARKKRYLLMLVTAEWKKDKHDVAKLFYEKSRDFKMANFVRSEFSDIAKISDSIFIDFVPAIIVMAYWPNSEKLPLKCVAKIEDADAVSFAKFLDKWVNKIIRNRLKVNLEYEEFMLKELKPIKLGINMSDPTPTIFNQVKEFLNSAAILILTEGELSNEIKNLVNNKIVYETFDVTLNADIREAIIKLSKIDVFPQLYINGSLVSSSVDTIRSFVSSPDFDKLVPADSAHSSLNLRLKRLIESHKIMLFIKGSPADPKCGFSRQIVELLAATPGFEKFGHFDILEDNAVREGLKTYSDWHTFPQLYINGELVGGLDVVRDLNDRGELFKCIE